MYRKFISLACALLLSMVAYSQESCIEFENPSISICSGNPAFEIPPANPSTGVYSGEYVTADGFFNSELSGAGTFEVFYTVSTQFCNATDTLIVYVQPTDSGLPFVGDLSICEGDSTTLTAPPGIEYYWLPGQKSNAFTYFPDSTTTYLISGPSPFGCSVYQEITIVVNDRNDAAAIVGPTLACYGEPVIYEVVGTDDFMWSDGSVAAVRTFVFTEDTTLVVDFGENPECDTTLSIAVDVSESLFFSWSVPISLCEGELFRLVIESTNADFFKFQGTTFLDSVDVFIPDDDTIAIEAYNNDGCFITQHISLIVNDLPNLELVAPERGCVDQTVNMIAGGAATYVWTDLETGQPFDTFLPGLHSFVSHTPDTFYYRIQGFSQYNCESSTEITFVFYQPPSVVIDTLTGFCENREIVLKGTGADFYSWNGIAGDSIYSFTLNTDSTIILMGYQVPECPAYDTVLVVLGPNPVMELLGQNNICELDASTLLASGVDYVYWNGQLGQSIFDVTPVYDSLIVGIGYNSFGCSDTAEIFIYVAPAPMVVFAGDPEICVGESGLLEVSTDGISFQWSDGSTDAIIPVMPADDTTYVVTAFADNGCDRTAEFVVTVYDYPVLDFQGNTTACYGDSLALTAMGADTYTWSNGMSGEYMEYVPVASSVLRLYGNSNDCISELPIAITVNERPVVHFEFTADTLCESGTGIGWIAAPGGGQLSGDGIVNNWFDLGAALSGLNTVTYSYTNDFNCTASATDNLIVEQCIGLAELSATHSDPFPNPFINTLFIGIPAGYSDVTIQSADGSLMSSWKGGSMQQVDTAHWSAGVYFIEFRSQNQTMVKRAVKL